MSEKIKKYVVRSLATIGALVLVMYIGLILFASTIAGNLASQSVDESVILEWDVSSLPTEVVDDLAVLQGGSSLSLFDAVMALKTAAEDTRVKGLLMKVSLRDEGVVGMAAVQELRAAILEFRESGKPVFAWADTFTESFTGHQAYYLASAAEEIHLQPSGDVALTGFAWEQPFVKDALDSMGIEADVFKRHEYKNALDPVQETSMTEPFREAVRALMTAQQDQLAVDIGTARELSTERVRELIDQGPFPAQQAKDMGLVDHLSYRDEIFDAIRKSIPESSFLYLSQYRFRRGSELADEDDGKLPKVALVYGVGTVLRGAADPSPFGGQTLSAETVAANLRAAAADEDVKAILFRIDSPGGSYVASDTVWREIKKIREAGIPVVASMGRLAGSGGYFVAMGTDHVIAQPGTITGSIGVVAGLWKTNKMWEKLGVRWDAEVLNQNALLGSGVHPVSDAQRKNINGWLDTVYDDFVSKAAEGRKMDKVAMGKIAKGRIWAGSDALKIGLIDELGGYSEAVKACKKLANIKEDARVSLVRFPDVEATIIDVLEMIAMKDLPESSEDIRLGQRRFGLPTGSRQLIGLLKILGPADVLSMPIPSGFHK